MQEHTSGRNKGFRARVRIDNMPILVGYFATAEEAQEAQEAFKAEANKPGMVLTRCYCNTRYVVIPAKWVGQRLTKSCGKDKCLHPAMLARGA